MLPNRNQGVNGIHFGEVFSAEECDQIRASARSEWQDGQIFKKNVGATGERSMRAVKEQRLPVSPANGFPLSKLAYEISRINSEIWRFDLSGFVSDDPPGLMRYDADIKGHYAWHIDVGRGATASRKLGFTLQLSQPGDYEGGDLEFRNVEVDGAAVRRRGALIVFPAYWLHRVAPVTRGSRYVVVGWVHGPTFR
jgi:PKHD-type hydroxylase